MLNKILMQLYRVLMLALLLSISSSYADGLPPLTHKLTVISDASPAPELQLKNLDGEVVALNKLKGKVVVVNFWATWCPPCRREMGSLERLYQKTKGHQVEVIAVNIGEDEDTVFSFTGEVEPSPNFQIVLDTEAASMNTWKVRGLPTTFIISTDGTIAYRAVGGREFDHPSIVNNIIDLTK